MISSKHWRVLILVYFLVHGINLFAQKQKPKTDWEDKLYKGKVKSVLAMDSDGVDTKNMYSKTETNFNVKGYITDIVRYNSQNEIDYKMTYVYDYNNNLSQEKRYKTDENSALVLEYRYKYFYNSLNLLAEEKHYTPDESMEEQLEETYLYKYDGKGNVTEIKLVDKLYKQVQRTTLSYDTSGNILMVIKFNADDIQIQKEKSTYDANSNRIQYISFDETGAIDATYLMKYDEKNQEIEWKSVDSTGKELIRNAFVYDANGMMIEQKAFDNANNADWQKTYINSYDKEGNWIRKLVYKDKKLKEIFSREISYY